MDYLTGRSTAPPPESQAVVIDVKSLDQLQFGEVLSGQRAETTPFRLPGLEAWAKGEVVNITEKAKIPVGGRGRPVFGLENPKAHDELLYGYGPYAPIGASPAVQATFQKCVSPAFQMSITPHSPVTVEVRDAQGQETGLSRAGAATDAIPGSLVSHSGRALKLVSLPAGTYTVKVSGTGAGPATLVFAVPTAGGISTQVFHFQSRAGASGTLRVSAAGAATRMDFGGRTLRAAPGLALSVHGLPGSVRHGRTAHLSLAIRELLGHGAPSVAVRLSGAAGSLHSSSRLSGRVHLTVDPTRRGSIRLQFSGPGYQSLTRTIRVR
jgi:hypothetical protein